MRYFRITGILLVLSFLVSCSSTKFVPEGDYLLNDVDIHVDNKSISREDLKAQIHQKENLKILGFIKFHLGIYDLSSRKKTNDWLKRIGEAPVIYQENQTLKSKEQVAIYLKNKGYYDAVVNDTVIYHDRKAKVNLIFNIETGIPYRIRKYTYDIKDPKIKSVILGDTIHQVVRENDLFDVDRLAQDRKRVVTLMKNHGYFLFSDENIQYLADSTLNRHQVDLKMEVSDADLRNKYEKVQHFKRFKVQHYFVRTDYSPAQLVHGRNEKTANDTLINSPYVFIYNGKLKYRPVLFEDLNRIPDSAYYSLGNVEKTYRSLTQLRQFRLVNMNFNVADSLGNDSIGSLDCNFQLSPLSRQGFSVDVEGTNSSGNLGIAGNLNYQHRNLFRGAEIFNVTLKTAFERQQAVLNESNLNFNTREFGVEATLTIPKFLSPVYGRHLFNYQLPKTSFSVGYNFQRRPDYTRTITNFRFGYNWKSSASRTHVLNLVDVNYVNLSAFNEDFLNSIRDLYIKSGYTDHLISAMNYTFVDNNQNINKRENYRYFKWTFESAGNLLNALMKLAGKEKASAVDTVTNQPVSYYQLLGTRFAQYIKTDFEYRYGYVLNDYSSLVGRAFFGIGLPYGNNNTLPFEKKYFTGGANGIRAWQVRTLGPGTYKASDSDYPNQSADIKLEGNLEYRFKLLGRLEGAFFLDAGNIWAINNKDNREGAQFKFDKFYKEIAIGTGTGLRFDFTYFIFRLDLGMKLRDPSLEPGKRFIIGNYPIEAKHLNLSFAIGYPF